MRRTMHALFLLAMLVAPAAAQSEAPVANPDSQPIAAKTPAAQAAQYPHYEVMPFATGTPSQLAAYMNCGPDHPGLWETYPAERAARIAHKYHHLNGCDCLDPKRNLYAHPSVIGGCNHCGTKSCGTQNCGTKNCDSDTVAARESTFNRYTAKVAEGFSSLQRKPFQITERRSTPFDGLSVQSATSTPATGQADSMIGIPIDAPSSAPQASLAAPEFASPLR